MSRQLELNGLELSLENIIDDLAVDPAVVDPLVVEAPPEQRAVPRRVYVRQGVLTYDYDAFQEYLAGRDQVTEFLRSLRDRNASFAQSFHAATTESAREAIGRARRGEGMADHLNDFENHVWRHMEATVLIIRTIHELVFNGFNGLADRLRDDLTGVLTEHLRHPSAAGN